jgi:hypothetical protein
VLPAGEWIELQHLPGRVLEAVEFLSAAARQVLLGAVEPEPFQDLAFEQRPDRVHPGPIPGPVHKVLLGSMRELIPESLDLGGLLVADHDGAVAPTEDLLLPAGQAPDLARQLRQEVAHELGQLLGILNP